MTSERSSPDLGARLRATAHGPDDDAAAQLRARLRHKMFGAGTPPEPPPVLDARFTAPPLPTPLLGWVIPSVAVVVLAVMVFWQRQASSVAPPSPAPRPLSRVDAKAEPRAARAVANEGPSLLAAAQAEADPAKRSQAVAVAVRASWAEVGASDRLVATRRLAQSMRGAGEPRRAIELLRAVLDSLELDGSWATARAQLLTELALDYQALGRHAAAAAVLAEARRLDPGAAVR